MAALSAFPLADHLIDFLPQPVASRLSQLSPPSQQSCDSEAALSLAGCHLLELLPFLSSSLNSSPILPLLRVALAAELQALPRGVAHSALQQAQNPSPLHKMLSGLPDKIAATCSALAQSGTSNWLVTGTVNAVGSGLWEWLVGVACGRHSCTVLY